MRDRGVTEQCYSSKESVRDAKHLCEKKRAEQSAANKKLSYVSLKDPNSLSLDITL